MSEGGRHDALRQQSCGRGTWRARLQQQPLRELDDMARPGRGIVSRRDVRTCPAATLANRLRAGAVFLQPLFNLSGRAYDGLAMKPRNLSSQC